jgi:hypothetical protein
VIKSLYEGIKNTGYLAGNMLKNDQFDTLNKNYERLEDDKKDTLLLIGENLLNIQFLVNKEKLSVIKAETNKFKNE